MYERVLSQMRERVRTLQYVMTLHAEEEMDNDGLSIFDVEQAILTGQITERQKDAETGEWKYLINGQSVERQEIGVVSKLSRAGKWLSLRSMLSNEAQSGAMLCDVCGQSGARIRHITRSYGEGASLLVIENVPIISCPHCGASYLTAETLHEIELIKSHRANYAIERSVPVAVLT